jgi:hypothetical protein
MAVIATLGLLAAAIAMLTSNLMHSTERDRLQIKAFNLAEAGMDAGQAALWVNWPKDENPSPAPTVDPVAFRASFSTSDFPDPVSGSFIDVSFYDDDGDVETPGIDRTYDWDQNGNGLLWIQSQASTGRRSAQVLAMVKKVDYELQIADGVAIATAGQLSVSGTGNQSVIGIDPPATAAQVYDNTYIANGNASWDPGVSKQDNTTLDYINTYIFPPQIVQNLVEIAQGVGKVFDTAADMPLSGSAASVQLFSSSPRIIVIRSGDYDAKDMPDTDGTSVWSEDDPGILILLGGNLDDTGLKKTIYGIVYLAQGILLRGNSEIHGMLVALTGADVRGTRAVCYNQRVMENLNKPTTLSVKLVPNTWRELPVPQPSASP